MFGHHQADRLELAQYVVHPEKHTMYGSIHWHILSMVQVLSNPLFLYKLTHTTEPEITNDVMGFPWSVVIRYL